METWGELFWDGWIRLRLYCRRLYRTYWPPRMKAWQVCTVTGVVSIVLTLVMLNLPAKTDAQAKTDKPETGSQTKKVDKSRIKANLAIASTDPFADAEVNGDANAPDATVMPPEQAETFESDTEPVPKRRANEEVALNDATIDEGQDAVAAETGTRTSGRRGKPVAAPMEEVPAEEVVVESNVFNESTLPPVASLTEIGVDADAEPIPAKSKLAADAEQSVVEEPSETESPAASLPATPVNELAETTEQPAEADGPDRVHYGRLGHHEDSEEDRHSVRNIRPTPLKDLPPPRQHTPFVTPIKPKTHYSRLGTHEDSEEDRHSVREIRPTRTDNVPTVAANQIRPILMKDAETPAEAHVVANEQAPTETAPIEPTLAEPMTPAELEPSTELPPPVPTSAPVREEPPARESSGDEPVVESTETVPELTPAVPGVSEPVTDKPEAPAVPEAEATEVDLANTSEIPAATETEPPPVLFAPEETPVAESTEADVSKKAEYHGPVKSTDATDHEAHQEEDAFDRPRRKSTSAANLTPAVKPIVKSTEAVDHEAHQEEDAFDRPRRKSIPAAKVAPADEPEADEMPPMPAEEPAAETPAVTEQPAAEEPQPAIEHPEVTERRKPAVDDAAETPAATTPRAPSHRTTPRVIRDDVAKPADDAINQHLDEDRVIPMGVTGVRGPAARITVPERIPAPEPAAPANASETEFAPVIRRPAPKLLMEITGPKQAPVGTQVVLHFKLQNTGNAPATGIVVTDVLPPGLQHRLSADLEYTVPRLMPGESRETNLTVQCVSCGTITNKAVLHADGDVTTEAEIQLEVTSSGPAAPVTPRASQSPLALKHHGPDRWLVDSTGQFLMTVTNTSNQPLQNVTITQTYPQGTTLVHATVGNKSDPKNRTVSWTIREFAPGVSYILETELHSQTSGPTTSIAKIKIGENEVTEDRWTAVSMVTLAP